MIIKLGRFTSLQPGAPEKAEFFATSHDCAAVLMVTKRDIDELIAVYRSRGPFGLTAFAPGSHVDPVKMQRWSAQGWDEFLKKIPDHANPIMLDKHMWKAQPNSGIVLPEPGKLAGD